MYVEEIFSGLDYENFPKCTTVKNEFKMDEMITVSGIKSISVCEHHFVTIDGLCKIAYIPKDKVLGLSKFNRIVKFFSQRPQIQERLTLQIYEALAYILETENVAVMIEADHYCVKQRGVEDNSRTTTTKLGGVFKENEVRNEFLKS
jgi:GTP cyclohydrolase I